MREQSGDSSRLSRLLLLLLLPLLRLLPGPTLRRSKYKAQASVSVACCHRLLMLLPMLLPRRVVNLVESN